MLFQSRLRLNTGISVDDIDAKCLAATTKAAATGPTPTAAANGPAEQAKLPSASPEVGVFSGTCSFGHGQQVQGAEPTGSFGDDDDEML